ncbi:diacylglycerol/lipid kinase family protein [Aerococcus suis]|uniref:Lipid kinase, YegS/Rv2252/BmrU family n=1 Tax=Aerococcus suis TaxID=371602 RepID=A0A1W1Y1T9_9LACT|nr:diacylglycerol kinase family protein [Aerococcus suis]MDY4646839.1 diacylglycerol kinase family lipid kinase [Aerococcus suis]SMC30116.1 lipid kinase, YegS/Rv2252/BmrU family [Aerococcus suis]
MSGCLLVINPSAGKGEAENIQTEIEPILAKHFGEVTVKYTEGEGDATKFVDDAKEMDAEAYFVVGGDGTVNEAINGLAALDHPMSFGFLPMGTVNDLARALGFPKEISAAIKGLKDYQLQPLDVGKINDQYFMNVVGIGAIPHAVNHTSSEEKSNFGFLAYLKDGVQAAIKEDSAYYDVTIDGTTYRNLKAEAIVIGLTNSVGGFEKMFKQAKVDDGKIHFLALQGRNTLKLVHELFQGLINGDISEAKDAWYETGEQIKIALSESQKEMETNVDGDPGPELPIELSILPSKLSVMVPKA